MEPAGIIATFAGSVPPAGWLPCDGSAVSRTDYATLFAVVGTTYGAGDGSTTFNLPDLSGRVVIGVSGTHALGSTGGSETVTLTSDQLPAHSHVVPQHGHGNDIAAEMPTLSHAITQPAFKYNRPNSGSRTRGSYSGTCYSSTNTATATRSTNAAVADHSAATCTKSGGVQECQAMNTGSTGTGAAHQNMQPYISISYIISTGG